MNLNHQSKLSSYYFHNISPAAKLTFVYLSVSVIWILLSDKIAVSIAHNSAFELEKIQSVKGLFFVCTLAFVLYYLSNKFYKDIKLANQNKEILEQSFSALNAAARNGIIDINFSSGKASVNSKMKFFIVESPAIAEEFVIAFYNRIHPADKKRIIKEYLSLLNNKTELWKTEYRILASDKQYYSVISSIYILRNEATGQPFRMIGELQDVTLLRNLQSDYFAQQLKYKQNLAASIIKVQEKERNRWAEELHDNVSQLLSVVNLYLGSMEIRNEENIEKLLKAKQFVIDAQQEIRLLSASIKPPAFSEMSLHASVERLIADITRIKNINLIFKIYNFDESKLNEPQQLLIFRVVQEQLNNIIKYADATRAEIEITIDKSEIIHITISDDGKGFDTKNMKTGVGFRNIQSRLQLYKGQMDIQSVPGNGCRLLVTFHV